MQSKTYAYIRVSSKDQNEARQVKEVLKFGVEKSNIIIEKASGKNLNRSKYRGLVSRLKTGDTLYINSIDRLGRDYSGIINEWYRLTNEQKIIIKVLEFVFIGDKAL